MLKRWFLIAPITTMFAMVSVAPSVAVASASLADGRAAVPFPMSSVTLTGDWKHAQDANQEVGATRCAFRANPPSPRAHDRAPCAGADGPQLLAADLSLHLDRQSHRLPVAGHAVARLHPRRRSLDSGCTLRCQRGVPRRGRRRARARRAERRGLRGRVRRPRLVPRLHLPGGQRQSWS